MKILYKLFCWAFLIVGGFVAYCHVYLPDETVRFKRDLELAFTGKVGEYEKIKNVSGVYRGARSEGLEFQLVGPSYIVGFLGVDLSPLSKLNLKDVDGIIRKRINETIVFDVRGQGNGIYVVRGEVALGISGGKFDLGEYLISHGLAYHDPEIRNVVYAVAQEEARKKGVGVWAKDGSKVHDWR